MDGIPAEFWINVGDGAMREIVCLCKEIYRTGEWPQDFVKTIMIPIPKTAAAAECGDYRTISLVSHVSEIMLRILARRLETRAESYISDSQFGFRKGVGTRDAIGVVRMLCEKSLEIGNDVYICFVDFEKAFDRVNWSKMMEILNDIGVDWRDRRLLVNLYMKQEVMVRVSGTCTEATEIGRGVRQGCLLSLMLSIYTRKQ